MGQRRIWRREFLFGDHPPADHLVPGRLEHADGPLEALVPSPFLLQSSLVVLLRKAHYPASLVGEIKPYALLVAQRYHEVGVRRDLALGQL